MADKAKRQSQMIESLPIEPEVEKTPKVKRLVDKSKKPRFKPPAYDRTLVHVVMEEKDSGVTEDSQQDVIDAARKQLNETSPIMVDGKHPEVLY